MSGKPTKPTDEQPAEAPQAAPSQMEQELSSDGEEGSTTFAQTNPTQAE